MEKPNFEKLGVLYLGKIVDPGNGKLEDELLLFESKNLTTHAVCVGMTGSGKTGLGITILEEVGMDRIPAIIIDPKGDLSNLLLTFPHLSEEEFLPWVDKEEAERKRESVQSYAKSISTVWKEGLAKWGETPERIQNLKKAVDIVIYTPASKSGRPLSILSSFAAPPKELMADSGAVRDKILSITSSLLGLLGIEADPIKSREHIYLSTIIDQAWQKGIDLDIGTLIQQVQKPPFDKVGVLDIDTFFPPKERLALSIQLNNLLASPGFQAWMEGEPLDIKQLLYTKEGKPKLAVLSIAHLSSSERMFFVTLLLNEFLAWMRLQPGTSSLRAVLYMDEIFGFFPPTAAPPSKLPMLTLLKQARAFGIGIVLATQNPVDLDYKGLANCGTWFIGKLQTQRDKERIVEGLHISSNENIPADTMEKMFAWTGNRTFIMRSIYEKNPILFQTRWTMSYLRGPLTLAQIGNLVEKPDVDINSKPESSKNENEKQSPNVYQNKPAVSGGIPEFFEKSSAPQATLCYKPQVIGIGKLHFVDAKKKVDVWKQICLISSVEDDGKRVSWESSANNPDILHSLDKTPAPNSAFKMIPSGLLQEKNYALFQKSFAAYLYQNQTLSLYEAPELKLSSKEDETEADFRIRMTHELRERRDALLKKIQDKYAAKIANLTEKLKRAQDKIAQKQQQAGWQKMDTFISFGSTLLGALLGRGVTKGTIDKAGTSIRRAGRISQENQGVAQAQEEFDTYQKQLEEQQDEMQKEIAAISASMDIDSFPVETLSIRPRKSDISVEKVALLWIISEEGT
jgi:hypothetical protein